jgi:hypothetical protein
MLPLPAVATTDRGAVARPDGTAVAATLANPDPNALTALTRNLYDVPLVRPDATYTVDGLPVLATNVVHVAPESVLDSMKYPLIGDPPSDVGVLQIKTTWLIDDNAVNDNAWPGAPYGIALAGDEEIPAPLLLTALTRNA